MESPLEQLCLHTPRLRLIALSREQLALYQAQPAGLEAQLGLPVSHDILTAPVRRAIGIKLAKMAAVPPAHHPWYTYWLIVVDGFGAGLAGYKGLPDAQGEVEIGYGIDPACRGQGYITEAVQALIDWAFAAPDCRTIIAPGTLKSNPASNRVLAKVGMQVYAEDETSLSWRIHKEER